MLLQDCNKILAVTNAITSFLVFKNLNISYNITINNIASSTFGILLIHTISDSMRNFLWFSTIDLARIYYSDELFIYIYIIGYCLVIFFVCYIFDYIRKKHN